MVQEVFLEEAELEQIQNGNQGLSREKCTPDKSHNVCEYMKK